MTRNRLQKTLKLVPFVGPTEASCSVRSVRSVLTTEVIKSGPNVHPVPLTGVHPIDENGGSERCAQQG